MLSKVLSGANIGLDAVVITCEVDIVMQELPSFTIVGLGDRAIEESKERVLITKKPRVSGAFSNSSRI